ncbi:MAG TPA: right-handed parallel beta-helix repeat-containing protein [Spirochaetota bacterium]|nr:right-handed parallel beta-helix repeat-containing protein [Spirochaetota bacterium]
MTGIFSRYNPYVHIATLVLTVVFCTVLTTRCSQEDFWDELTSIKTYPSVTASPVNGSFLAKNGFNHEIILTYSHDMQPDSLQLSGAMSGEASTQWTSGRTLRIYPASQWTTAPKTALTVTCNDKNGTAVTASLNYGIYESVICVSTTGSPANPGSRAAPKSLIQDGITAASAAGIPSVVMVSEGDYNVPGIVADMADGISLYGGYSSSNWDKRDASLYITRMNDTRTAVTGTSIDNITLLRTINYSGTITNSILDGFTINAAQIDDNTNETLQAASAAIYIEGASPTIQNNIINGNHSNITEDRVVTAGIVIRGTIASPTIFSNTINGGKISSNFVSGTDGRTYGIFLWPSTPSANTVRILNNTINAGVSSGTDGDTTAVYVRDSTPEITGNTIHGGTSTNRHTYGIMLNCGAGVTVSPDIKNNTIHGGSALKESKAFFVSGNSTGTCEPVIENNTINGGGAGDVAYGFYVVSYSKPKIVHNTITCDAGGGSSFGIHIGSSAAPSISGNIIFSGDSITSMGIRVWPESSSFAVPIWNNVIKGGAGNFSRGIYIRDEAKVQIFNNSIHGGAATNATGIYLQNASAATFDIDIQNNNIFCSDVSANRYGIYENDANSSPVNVKNNNFFHLDVHYYDDPGTSIVLESGLNALSGSTSSGNIIEDIYADITGNSEYRFTGDPGIFTFDTGGIDGSVAGWGFNDDRDGNARSVPWSIGPYEY